MKIEFSENIKEDIKDLIMSLPLTYRQLANNDSFQEIINNTILRINDSERFYCNTHAEDKRVIISACTIEIIWAITCAHSSYYELFCKGVEPDGKCHSLDNPIWATSDGMLDWAKETLKLKLDDSYNTFDSYGFPRYFCDHTEITIIFKYALLFFVSHEMFHIKHYNKFQELMLEENECDLDALRLILNSIEDADYLLKMKGVCIGLMIINVYGIHTGNYDGKSHPLTYDRLINNLKLFFGQENDKVWGFVVALFALHMTKEGLVNEENNQKEFNTFYDCILGYKTILEMHNSSK